MQCTTEIGNDEGTAARHAQRVSKESSQQISMNYIRQQHSGDGSGGCCRGQWYSTKMTMSTMKYKGQKNEKPLDIVDIAFSFQPGTVNLFGALGSEKRHYISRAK